MPADERDRQFERALQRHLRATSPDAACPDAETLAAYHERTLSLEEMTRWKEHIVACSMCQETLALLEETNSVALHEWEEKDAVMPTVQMARPAKADAEHGAQMDESSLGREVVPQAAVGAGISAKPRSRLKWIVPLGALAAGLLIFVTARENRFHTMPEPASVQVAQNRDAAASPLPVPETQEADKLSKSPDAEAQLSAPLNKKDGRDQKPAAPTQRMKTPLTEEAGRLDLDPAEKMKSESANELAWNMAPQKPAAAPPLAKSAPAASGGASRQNKAVAPPMPSQAPASSTTADFATAEARQSVELSTSGRSTVPMRDQAAANRNLIMVPGGKIFWRVGPAGKIEVSTDAGNIWTLQGSGVTSDLIAGSAPSEAVCWVVGSAGTVLLTVDGGAHWRRVVSPSPADLRGIHAVDAQHATVWAGVGTMGLAAAKTISNSRGFVTSNGGVSWAPVAME
jgi:hypothetical protein